MLHKESFSEIHQQILNFDILGQKKTDVYVLILPSCLDGIRKYLLVILKVKKFAFKLIDSVRYSESKN